MKRSSELKELFSDARLEPDRHFVRRLGKQLTATPERPKTNLRRWVLLPTSLVLAVATVLTGLALLHPAPKQSKGSVSASTVLISKLYGTATADALPEQSAITFWDTTQETTAGPAAAACHVYIAGPNPPIRWLMFRDGGTTAAWSQPPEGAPYMSYSEDSEMPAFDADALNPLLGLQFSYVLSRAVLTDQSGKRLPAGASTPVKQTGAYDLYATESTELDDGTKPMPDCPVQFIRLRIDAATGMFTEADIYNGVMSEATLALKVTQTIATGTGDFTAELPKFTAVGFNLAQAKNERAGNSTAQVENRAAGYKFLYDRASLGTDAMTETKSADGGVAAYNYRFTAQPDVRYRIYTSKAGNQRPQDLAALKAMAQAKGWRVLSDKQNAGNTYLGYPKAPTEMYIATDDSTIYGMFATGTPDIPYAYVEAPSAVFSVVWQLLGITPSTPSGQVSTGL